MSEDTSIDISGLDKAELLVALYTCSRPMGLGWREEVQNNEGLPHTAALKLIEQAEQYQRSGRLYFDYVRGRAIKCDLHGDTLDPRLYDRDNGRGAARRAVDYVRDKNAELPEGTESVFLDLSAVDLPPRSSTALMMAPTGVLAVTLPEGVRLGPHGDPLTRVAPMVARVEFETKELLAESLAEFIQVFDCVITIDATKPQVQVVKCRWDIAAEVAKKIKARKYERESVS